MNRVSTTPNEPPSIDPIDVQRRSGMAAVEWHPRIDSTSDDLLRRSAEWSSLPVLLGADEQTRGRGRGANSWWAGAGSLTFSILLDPAELGIPPDRRPLIALTTGLALVRTLPTVIPEQRIALKWPNDVLLDGRKLAGILIESVPAEPYRLVIGIGVNLNNSLAAAPDDVRQRAVSLAEVAGAPVDATEFLVQLLENLHAHLRQLGEAPAEIVAGCRAYCLLTGRMVTISTVAEEVTGYCQGLDDDGALRLSTARGPQRVLAGAVLWYEGAAHAR